MFTSIMRSHSSTFSRSSGECGMRPALLIMTSMRPNFSTAVSTSLLTWSRLVTSVASVRTSPPRSVNSLAIASRRSVRRAPSTTGAPAAERCRAAASPRPLLAPVMTMTFPAILPLMILSGAHALYCWSGYLFHPLDGFAELNAEAKLLRIHSAVARVLAQPVAVLLKIVPTYPTIRVRRALAVRLPDLAAAVSFYGRQPPAVDAAKINAPLLLHRRGLA